MEEIPGYERLYAATKIGKIWAYPKPTAQRWKSKGRFLKPYVMKHGYNQISLYKDGKVCKYLVHQLIAMCFLSPKPSIKHEINHKDLNKSNNSFKNLEWVTHKENKEHSTQNGHDNKGSKHGMAKLDEKQVRQIKSLLKRGLLKQKDIAKRFKVSPMTISDIARRRLWKHVN